MCLVLVKLYIVIAHTITVQNCTTYITIITTITTRSLFLSVYNLFASNSCSLFLSHNYSLDLQNHNCLVYTQLHIKLTKFLPPLTALYCLLYAQVFSRVKVLEVEAFHLFENSFAVTLQFVKCLLRLQTCLFLVLSCLLLLVYVFDVFVSMSLCVFRYLQYNR